MFWTVTLSLLSGMGRILKLFFLTLLFSLPLGLLIAFALRSRCKPVSWLFNVIVWIIRGTPLMLQLIIIFYGPGKWSIITSGPFSPMAVWQPAWWLLSSTTPAISPSSTRAASRASPWGSRRPVRCGLTKSQIFLKVTLLQMVKRIVPPMSNEIITLVKDTSLARIIAVTELIKAGESYMKSAGIIWPLFYTAVFYLAFVGILTLLFNYIERKLSYFR